MSTYEDEHAIERSDSVETTASGSRRIPTLQQALNEFMNTSSSTENQRHFSEMMLGEIFGGGGSQGGNIEDILRVMIQNIDTLAEINTPGKKGVDQAFLDNLDRVDINRLKCDATCPICTNEYRSDPYPLVVELPCNSKHRFDMDCIAPWLKFNNTCPLCRADVTVKPKKFIPVITEEEEESGRDMYG